MYIIFEDLLFSGFLIQFITVCDRSNIRINQFVSVPSVYIRIYLTQSCYPDPQRLKCQCQKTFNAVNLKGQVTEDDFKS